MCIHQFDTYKTWQYILHKRIPFSILVVYTKYGSSQARGKLKPDKLDHMVTYRLSVGTGFFQHTGTDSSKRLLTEMLPFSFIICGVEPFNEAVYVQ